MPFCARCSCEKVADAFYANDRTCKECRKDAQLHVEHRESLRGDAPKANQ